MQRILLKSRINTISSRRFSSLKNIDLNVRDKIAILKLNRPERLNALSSTLIKELCDNLESLKHSGNVRVAIITGDGKAFAAGADIKEMSNKSFSECLKSNFLGDLQNVFREFPKPIIAAVNGYALGGGCELAMLCDIIVASSNAKFSQPEIKLGTIPGAGGTQRLTRTIGKYKAMDLILTGRHISAEEAEKIGLVSRVVPHQNLLEEAMSLAQEISTKSECALVLCKQAINMAFETNLYEGLEFEKRLFHSTFATGDQKEGMSAFLEKREPKFEGK